MRILRSEVDSTKTISKLRELANFGLRDVLDFLAHYTWLPAERADRLSGSNGRYLTEYPVGLITFILQSRRLYSEAETFFPNIYLCNVDELEVDQVEPLDSVPPLDIEGWPRHVHSYWIRRLILTYIACKNRAQQSVTLGDVLDVFSLGAANTGYEEGFVRMMLGSLSENHAANLVAVSQEISSDNRTLITGRLQVTPRGHHCLDDIFDHFFYLQLVVDDYSLYLPKVVSANFEYLHGAHYGYLSVEGHTFGQRAREMVQRKATLVIEFIAILSAAYEFEQTKHLEVFDRLREEGVVLPDPNALKLTVLEEFDAINRAITPTVVALSRDSLEEQFKSVYDCITPALRAVYRM